MNYDDMEKRRRIAQTAKDTAEAMASKMVNPFREKTVVINKLRSLLTQAESAKYSGESLVSIATAIAQLEAELQSEILEMESQAVLEWKPHPDA